MFGMLIFCTDSICKDVEGFGVFFYLLGKSYVDDELLKISCVYVNSVTERLVNMIER